MNLNQQQGILDEVQDVPTALKEVKMAPRNIFEAVLIRTGMSEPKRKILYLKNTKLSTAHQLTLIVDDMTLKNHRTDTVDGTMQMIYENTYLMATYVATAIQNENKPAPGYLIQTIADEFTNEELKLTLTEVYRRLHVEDFMHAAALTQSLQLL